VLFWLSLAVSLAVVIGAIAFVVRRGLALWRQFAATARALGWGLEQIGASAEATANQADGLGGASERLDVAVARLAVSRARLRILQEAWSDVSAALGGVSSYVPREKKA
jgi:hypothetical protein